MAQFDLVFPTFLEASAVDGTLAVGDFQFGGGNRSLLRLGDVGESKISRRLNLRSERHSSVRRDEFQHLAPSQIFSVRRSPRKRIDLYIRVERKSDFERHV